jgi:hypothetical protein
MANVAAVVRQISNANASRMARRLGRGGEVALATRAPEAAQRSAGRIFGGGTNIGTLCLAAVDQATAEELHDATGMSAAPPSMAAALTCPTVLSEGMAPHSTGSDAQDFQISLDWGDAAAPRRAGRVVPAPPAGASSVPRARSAQMLALLEELTSEVRMLERGLSLMERRLASMERALSSVVGRDEQVEPALGRAPRKFFGRIR